GTAHWPFPSAGRTWWFRPTHRWRLVLTPAARHACPKRRAPTGKAPQMQRSQSFDVDRVRASSCLCRRPFLSPQPDVNEGGLNATSAASMESSGQTVRYGCYEREWAKWAKKARNQSGKMRKVNGPRARLLANQQT